VRRWRLLPVLLCGLVAVPAGAADPKPADKKDAAPFEVPYRLTETNHVMVRVKINGKGPFNLILDTGAPAVFITKKVAKAAGVELDADGWSNPKTFELEGGLKVDKTKTRVEDLFQLEGMNGMGLAGVELHGVIGYNVLARFRIQYDFTADKLKFEPLPFDPPPVTPLGGKGDQGGLQSMGGMMKFLAAFMGIKPNFEVVPRGFVGVEIDDGDGVVVKKVLPGSPAEKGGLKAGDRIESVKSVGVDDARDLARALAKAGVGQTLKVAVKRGGKSETLTLELGKGL
jgi:serine protease DegQ